VEGEIVVVKIKEVFSDVGIYCSLMEYNGIEGYVDISELTRRQIRSTRQSAMKRGELDLAKVTKVDAERGFIDLNKEQLPHEVVEEVTIRWNNSKKVNSIMKSVAQRLETPVEGCYSKFLWPLARHMKKQGKNVIAGLSCFLHDPEGMTNKYGLQRDFVDALIPRIRNMLEPKQHRITALIQANSSSWQGITLIKKALKAGALVSTPNCPVQIVLKRPPSTWQIKINTLKPQEGSTVIWKILEKIRRVLTRGNRGQFRLIKAPIMRDPKKKETLVVCQDLQINILVERALDYDADYDLLFETEIPAPAVSEPGIPEQKNDIEVNPLSDTHTKECARGTRDIRTRFSPNVTYHPPPLPLGVDTLLVKSQMKLNTDRKLRTIMINERHSKCDEKDLTTAGAM